jgi:DeoR/GlpR family transcriptional regulator of sugar metabolism
VTDPDPRNEGGAERRSWIMSALRPAGFLAIIDIAREFGVSSMTVRRDLHALESAGRVRLVHGGATLSAAELRPTPFPHDGNEPAHTRIGAFAARLVAESDTIALDAGPTAYALARALPTGFRGSIITHSMPVLQLLDQRQPPLPTVALGGELQAERHAFVGPTAEAAAVRLRARTFFLSTAAADRRGTYSCSPAEASLQQRLIEIADEVVLVATHEVFAGSAPACVAPLDRLTAVVTDRHPTPTVSAALDRAGVTVHVADR